MPLWLQAGFWGLVASSASLVGAAAGYFARVPQRLLAGVMVARLRRFDEESVRERRFFAQSTRRRAALRRLARRKRTYGGDGV